MWISTIRCCTEVINFSKTLKIVFAVHFVLVCVLSIHHLFSKEKPKTKMVVRTIQTPKQVVATSPVKTTPSKKTSPVAKPTVAKAQAPVKVIPSAKKEIAISKEGPKETIPSKGSEITLPKEIPVIKTPDIVKESPSIEVPSYGEILTTYLQNSLDLPEYGEVKVDLEIDPYGHLVRFEILEEKSKKNAEFLKKRLPELILPCFNERGKLHETVVFTITFKNSSSRF